IVEHQAGRQRRSAWLTWRSGRIGAPAQPARSGEVDDHVQLTDLKVEELAVSADGRDHTAAQGGNGRIECLECGKGDQVEPVDGAPGQARTQIDDERMDLWQFWHALSLGQPTDIRPASHSLVWEEFDRRRLMFEGGSWIWGIALIAMLVVVI